MSKEPAKIFEVSELTSAVKAVIEGSFPESIAVRGEISNFTRHSSGHLYFSLKDMSSVLRCVCFRGSANKLRFDPSNGVKVVCDGQVTVYERSGQYQMVVRGMKPLGAGDLAVAFEELKRKLAEEGLFDAELKRPLPKYPERIGIATSATGAAVKDIINVLSRRWQGLEIVVRNTKVQGPGAAEDIAAAIAEFNMPDDRGETVDVLIIGRGGGSLEDLWAFNEEVTVRAVVSSHIPIISAVGHEIDYALTDFAADFRAPTPSAAAEIAVTEKEEYELKIERQMEYAYTSVTRRIELVRSQLKRLSDSYQLRNIPQRIEELYQDIDELTVRGERAARSVLRFAETDIHSELTRIKALDPKKTLARGFSVICDSDGSIIKSVGSVSLNSKVNITLEDGTIDAQVTDKKEGEVFER